MHPPANSPAPDRVLEVLSRVHRRILELAREAEETHNNSRQQEATHADKRGVASEETDGHADLPQPSFTG